MQENLNHVNCEVNLEIREFESRVQPSQRQTKLNVDRHIKLANVVQTENFDLESDFRFSRAVFFSLTGREIAYVEIGRDVDEAAVRLVGEIRTISPMVASARHRDTSSVVAGELVTSERRSN